MVQVARHAPFVSPEQYLAADRAAETRSEYLDGVVVAFVGASRAHNSIVFNLVSALGPQLRGTRCQGFPSDMRVWSPQSRSFVFPDLVVVCGEPELFDEQQDVLLNPTLLIEVLSPSTERYDRGAKATAFRQIPSLREYLFVHQDSPHVERVQRYAPLQWMLNEWIGLEAELDLPSIGCTLLLRDIYDNVF